MKLVPLKSLRLHPEANRVPRMPPEQDAEFRAEIAERGIRVPIEIIDGGVIVDGRSRYLAAKQLGIKRVPVIRAPLNGDDSCPRHLQGRFGDSLEKLIVVHVGRSLDVEAKTVRLIAVLANPSSTAVAGFDEITWRDSESNEFFTNLR